MLWKGLDCSEGRLKDSWYTVELVKVIYDRGLHTVQMLHAVSSFVNTTMKMEHWGSTGVNCRNSVLCRLYLALTGVRTQQGFHKIISTAFTMPCWCHKYKHSQFWIWSGNRRYFYYYHNFSSGLMSFLYLVKWKYLLESKWWNVKCDDGKGICVFTQGR